MPENLANFLVGLASDPARMTRFLADPAAEINAAPLSPHEKTALLTRDSAQLRRALGASPVDHMTIIPKKKKGAKKGGKKRGGAKAARKK